MLPFWPRLSRDCLGIIKVKVAVINIYILTDEITVCDVKDDARSEKLCSSPHVSHFFNK